MSRPSIADIQAGKADIDSTVTVRGWVRTRRDSKAGLSFVHLHDGSCFDALQIVAEGVNGLRSPERSMLVITHYQRLLDYIVPDQVHVLFDGRIVRSGDKSLALELEDRGYAWVCGEEAHEPAGA